MKLELVLKSDAVAEAQQDQVADLLFDHEVGLGLEIIRYNIGGSSTAPSAVNSMRPGGAVPSLLLPNGTYNWTLVSIICMSPQYMPRVANASPASSTGCELQSM